jgi:transcriptional regulator with XRE-family HTH domain
MDTGLRQLRKIARLTQIELSQRTGIDRTRLSFLECGYLSLTKEEESLIRKAITEATESHAARVRDALAVTAEPAGVGHKKQGSLNRMPILELGLD